MSAGTTTARIIHVQPASSCENCRVRRLCLPVGLDPAALARVGRLVRVRGPIKSNEYVYRSGDAFRCLYAVRSGAVKTYGLTRDGREQVTGFHLAGELLGMEAIDTRIYNCNAMVLEETELCELPFDQLERLAEEVPALQHELARMMSRELREEENALIMLGGMSAEQRIACFLQSLYRRMSKRWGDVGVLRLPMSRTDIGNYLGLTVETVSRRLGLLRERCIIAIKQREIRLLDPTALGRLCAA